jgi:hypothetical protein
MTNFEISKEDLDYLRSLKVMIATPCYGGQCFADYLVSVVKLGNLFSGLGMEYSLNTIANESLITRARNLLAEDFMDSECTHMIFIDADVSFEAADVIRLLLHKKQIIAGTYPLKKINWEEIYAHRNSFSSSKEMMQKGLTYVITVASETIRESIESNQDVLKLKDGLLPTQFVGTGFMLIEKIVFEKMRLYYPDDWFEYKKRIVYLHFDTVIEEGSKNYLSEDYYFCKRWSAMGGEIWVDPTIALNHNGYYRFEGSALVTPIIGDKPSE